MKRGHKGARTNLSAGFLRQIFDYNPSTGELRWKRPGSRRMKIGDLAGCVDDQGRRKVRVQSTDYFVHRIARVYMTGVWPQFEVDHINGVRSDNRWANLREATAQQNMSNRPKQRNNTSGYKGVCETKPGSGIWMAGIKFMRKRKHLGCFKTREEAYAAYQAAARKVFGKFSNEHKT